MNRPNFPSMAHDIADVNRTIEVSGRVREKYNTALERGTLEEAVKGKLPRVLFSGRR